MTVTKRLFIGGLSNNVSEEEISERFSRFGKVSNLSLKTRTDELGNTLKSFAHLDLEGDEASIKKCFNTYQNAKWKGTTLQLQYAKESFLHKLEKEIKETNNEKEVVPEITPLSTQTPQHELLQLKGHGVPGTPVPGMKDWVVGKYGRVLPVLKLKKSYKIQMEKHDPSKHCHAAKVFKDDTINKSSETPCTKLTWEINTQDTEITKKRKGEFPDIPQSSKKPKGNFLSLSDFYKNKEKLLFNKKDVDDVEIVKTGLGNSNSTTAKLNKSNRFDSDAESDSEDVVYSKNFIGGLQGIKSISQTAVQNIESISVKTSGELARGQPATKPGTDVKQSLKPVIKTSEISVSKLCNNNLNVKTAQNRENNTCEPSEPKLMTKNNVTVTAPKTVATLVSPSLLPTKKTSAVTKFEVAGHRKIPEFKGLGMIDLSPGNDCAPHTKSEQLAESHSGSIIDNKLSPETKAPATKLPGEKTQPHGAGSLSSPGKLNPVPELYGSNMQSGISTISSEAISSANTKHVNERPDQMSKNQLKEKLKNAGNKQLLTSKLTNNLPKSVSEESGEKNYDSASSADTDEIIAQCKKRKGLVSPKQVKELQKMSQNVHTISQQTRSEFGKSTKPSFVDRNLNVSEYIAGIADPMEQPVLGESLAGNSDVSDSDLDSNDFALVARKLAHKAALAKRTDSKTVSGEANGRNTFSQRRSLPEADVKKNQEKKLFGTTGARTTADGVLDKAKTQGSSKHLNDSKGLSKKAADNEKRLQAIRENMKLKEAQQSIGLDAFKNVDSKDGRTGSRLVFSSSDEESSDNEDEVAEKKKSKLELFNSSSDEEEEDEDYGDIFQSKPHFEGEKGEKLMKLEQKISDPRFKLDAKFAVSDSEEEEDEPPEEAVITPEVNPSLEEEKTTNLKVLENVIGKTTLDRFSQKLKRNTKHIIDMNAVRFDPTKMQATQVLSQAQSKVPPSKKATKAVNPTDKKSILSAKVESDLKAQKKVTFNEEQNVASDSKTKGGKVKLSDEKPQLNNAESTVSNKADSAHGANAQMSTSLVDLFKKKMGSSKSDEETKSFSLLQQFDLGEDTSDEDEGSSHVKRGSTSQSPLSALFKKGSEVTDKTVPAISSSVHAQSAETSSSGGESTSGDTTDEEGTERSTKQVEEADKRVSFPVDEEDSEESMDEDISSQLVDNSKDESGAELINAGRVDVRFSKDQWLQRWEDIRPAIVKLFKRKHKDAMRNKRKNSEMKRKTDFLKNSKRHRWARKRVS